jgi:hypothetical protein
MSTILFSKTFISKITSIIRNFWWAGSKKTMPPLLSTSDLGRIFAGLKEREA